MALELWTVDDAKSALGISGDEYDTFIETTLNSIEGYIRSYLGTSVLVKQNITDETAENSGVFYATKAYPIHSISALTLEGNDISTDEVMIGYGNIYYPYGLNGEIVISYNAGFDTDDIAFLKSMVLQYLAFELQNLRGSRWGETSRTFADGTASWKTSGEYQKEMAEKLNYYRRTILP